MEQNTLRKQRELTDRLNRYRNEYYSLPYREDWRREEARDAGDSFYLLIKTDD